MTNRHDGVVFLRPRRHFQLAGNVIGCDDERVIAAGLKRRLQPREHALTVVHDRRRLAVHRRLRTADRSSVHDPDRLVSKAHTEYRRRRSEAPDDVTRNACIFGPTWTWRDHDLLGGHRANLVDGDLVVAPDTQDRAKLAEILHEVVGERVVVIYH